MLNVWNFKLKKKKTKPKQNKKQNKKTAQKCKIKLQKRKMQTLRDTEIFQTEALWNYEDYEISITSLDNKLNFAKSKID